MAAVTENSAVPPPRGTAKKLRTRLTGYDLLNNPLLNKGTAFPDEERDRFFLHGLLPPHVGTLEEQEARRRQALEHYKIPFNRYSFMRDLQDANETLFYSLVIHNIRETLPIVYTPTVGEGCQRFSEIWHKPRGVFLSYPNRHRIDQILSHPHYDSIQCIVVSDGERILGLGDQGAGGMGIPIGKLALYTALGGIHPANCLPVLLDVGTDNEALLANPLYIGWCHKRVRGPEYDAFVDDFVSAVKRRWPHVLLQWEDFAGSNAERLLNRYRDQLCTFNDDIQGTAAVATATLLATGYVTGVPIKDQRIAFFGFGSAGIGIANLLVSVMRDQGLTEPEAHQRIYPIGRHGLLVEGGPGVRPEQQAFARQPSEVRNWQLSGTGASGEIGLDDVVRNARPTVLIGVSGLAGAFTEDVIRAMAAYTDRPIVFPLSNPTSRSEATPQQLLDWSGGRALIGTGSPFEPVNVNGRLVPIDQTNNSYIFPGLALGVISSQARRVSDGMIKAAALALASLSPALHGKNASLLPPLESIRSVSRTVATAVGRQALQEGLTPGDERGLESAIESNIWEPVYLPYELDEGQ
jgi:malate dehydrogenase (oxaloacetate-decarboxylating)